MKKIGKSAEYKAFLAALLACSVFLAGWADDPETIRKKVAFVESIRADFIQEKHLEMMDKPLISKGVLFFRAPASLRWEYKEPVRSVLLMHNDKISRYVETDDGIKARKSGNLETMRVFLEDICMWMQGRFDVNPDLNAEIKPSGTVVLTPKDKAMAEVIERIELRLSETPGVIDSVAIHENPASYTIIRFHDTKINKGIKEGVFQELNFKD
ncbi:MAG: outer membrane lipoprotein carrier protein LolA [Desulfobacteraceae bacterium]|nr:outer membrane lipoprotein carrier protein LolA [Desulfobacteraceae bacterium]